MYVDALRLGEVVIKKTQLNLCCSVDFITAFVTSVDVHSQCFYFSVVVLMVREGRSRISLVNRVSRCTSQLLQERTVVLRGFFFSFSTLQKAANPLKVFRKLSSHA